MSPQRSLPDPFSPKHREQMIKAVGRRAWEKGVLDYNPFGGDQGDVGDRELRDNLVVCRAPGVCHLCAQKYKAGTMIRSIVMVWVADGLMAYKFCTACCDAMAKSWTDEGRALTARHALRKAA